MSDEVFELRMSVIELIAALKYTNNAVRNAASYPAFACGQANASDKIVDAVLKKYVSP